MAHDGPSIPRAAAAGATALLVLSGCATQTQRGDQLLEQLAAVLPGSYDNLAQSRTDADHPALKLMIVPVLAPLVGDHVFYVQETAADDPRRVLAQRLYQLDQVQGRDQVVLSQYDLNEPTRWRDGQLNRDLFRSMLQQDVRLRPGCELVWQRKDAGFVASIPNDTCRTSSRSTGETLHVAERMELGAETLGVFEQHRDAAGAIVYGGIANPWFRFIRRADAPW